MLSLNEPISSHLWLGQHIIFYTKLTPFFYYVTRIDLVILIEIIRTTLVRAFS